MHQVRVALLLAIAALPWVATSADGVADEQLAYAYEIYLAEDPEGEQSAGIWLKLANIRLRQSRHEDARNAYRRVVALAPPDTGREMMLAGRLGVGLSFSGEGRYAEAVRELTGAIDDAGDSPVRGNLVAVYRELANIGLHTENYESVIRYAGAAREAYRTLGHWEDEAVMLLVIGVAHAETGAFDRAAAALRRSFDLFSERGADDVAHREQAVRVSRIARGYGIDDGRW